MQQAVRHVYVEAVIMAPAMQRRRRSVAKSTVLAERARFTVQPKSAARVIAVF